MNMKTLATTYLWILLGLFPVGAAPSPWLMNPPLAADYSPLGQVPLARRTGEGPGVRAFPERVFELSLQRRDAEEKVMIEMAKLDPKKTAIVVVDMWDRHWCKTYTARVGNLVPRMNQTLEAARKLGIQVVWTPSDVVSFYKDHPARKAMRAIPAHAVPATTSFDPPPAPKGDNCECGPGRPCRNAAVWTRQHPGLVIIEGDLIGDCNNIQELLNLCAERGIDTLIYMGVASNMCVCYRSMGMINARRYGFRLLFVADLVEAITANGVDPVKRTPDPNFTPAKGTALVQCFLEHQVAPSIESRQILAAAAPATRDRRPHVAFVIADDEYKSEQTLPAFAKEHLEKDFGCTFCVAKGNQPPERNDIPGLEALYDADLVVLSVRRRALPVTQMDHLERYLRAGKPLVAFRVSVTPFQVEPKDRPDGHVLWRDFDWEVLGCHYRGYNAESRKTGSDVWAVPEAREHPILLGLGGARFHSPMWIYRQNPLATNTTVLLRGGWSAQDPEEPVAWTNTREGTRVFYTTLGHWEDFRNPAFTRLLRNAIYWAVEKGASAASPGARPGPGMSPAAGPAREP
jgi:nicotinamidase-related amidase